MRIKISEMSARDFAACNSPDLFPTMVAVEVFDGEVYLVMP